MTNSNLDMFVNVTVAFLGVIVGVVVMLIYKSGKTVGGKMKNYDSKMNSMDFTNMSDTKLDDTNDPIKRN